MVRGVDYAAESGLGANGNENRKTEFRDFRSARGEDLVERDLGT